MGGLARRVSALSRLRADANIPVLTLVGADEFGVDAYVPPDSPDPVKTGKASPDTVRRAYNALGVDAGYLSVAAATWFGETLPQRFVRVADSPVVRRVLIGGVSVALVFFPPEVSAPVDTRSANRLLNAVLVAARSVADADIRIGVSPWGFQHEREALAALAQDFDVLLGAGPGAPLVAEIPVATPSLLWSRPELDGKSLFVLDFMDIPATGTPRNWTLLTQCREVSLSAHIPSDPQMERILEGK